MNALLGWIEDRTGLCSAIRSWLDRPVPGGPAWLNVWPTTIAFLFFTQLVTGVVLWMYYSPGAQTAWESVYYIQTQVLGGWMLRAVHHYAAQVMLVLIGVYLVQTILRRAYRAPRELLFWTIVLSGVLTLALNLTGDLLAWDQNGYSCTQVRTGFLLLLPRIGGELYKLAVGGPAFGHLTATRFLALHAGVLTAALLATLALHAWFAARCARRLSQASAGSKCSAASPTGRARPPGTPPPAWPSWPSSRHCRCNMEFPAIERASNWAPRPTRPRPTPPPGPNGPSAACTSSPNSSRATASSSPSSSFRKSSDSWSC